MASATTSEQSKSPTAEVCPQTTVAEDSKTTSAKSYWKWNASRDLALLKAADNHEAFIAPYGKVETLWKLVATDISAADGEDIHVQWKACQKRLDAVMAIFSAKEKSQRVASGHEEIVTEHDVLCSRIEAKIRDRRELQQKETQQKAAAAEKKENAGLMVRAIATETFRNKKRERGVEEDVPLPATPAPPVATSASPTSAQKKSQKFTVTKALAQLSSDTADSDAIKEFSATNERLQKERLEIETRKLAYKEKKLEIDSRKMELEAEERRNQMQVMQQMMLMLQQQQHQ